MITAASHSSVQSPCTACPKRVSCRAICADLEKAIPPAYDFPPFEEISTDPGMMDVRNHAAEPEVERPSGWRWADIADEVRPHFQKAIDEILTDRQRQIILLILDGYRQVEIARQFNIRRVTVHWIFKRARYSLWLWFGGEKIRWRGNAFERIFRSSNHLSVASDGARLDLYPGDIDRQFRSRRNRSKAAQLSLFPSFNPVRFPHKRKRKRSNTIIIRFYRGRPVPVEQLPLPFYFSAEKAVA